MSGIPLHCRNAYLSLACVQVLEDVPPAADGVEALVGGLAPRVLTLFCSPHADIKRLAVGVMNLLAAGAPPGGLGAVMETYRLGLFGLARDPAPGVRRAVCSGLVQLLHLQPEALVPQMRDIIEYMLESSQVSDSIQCRWVANLGKTRGAVLCTRTCWMRRWSKCANS